LALAGPDGLLKQLTKKVLETASSEEISGGIPTRPKVVGWARRHDQRKLVVSRSQTKSCGRRGPVMHRREPISDARFGNEVAGSGWVGFEFAAEVGQVDAQVVGFLLVCRPQTWWRSCRWATSFAGFSDERFEQVPFRGGQAHVAVWCDDLSGGEVDGE